jgi:hypothetical protein
MAIVSIKKQNRFLMFALLSCIVFIICGISFIVWTMYKNKNDTTNNDMDKVCMRKTEYDKLLIRPTETRVVNEGPSRADERDRKVMNDPLYPPLNRSETSIHNSVADAVERKQLYNRTRETTDRYRLVAYITSTDEKKDSGGNTWKLLAREKDRNRSEFYIIPANNNYDMKIMITDDIIIGEKLRDIYTIPKQLTFSSPLLNETSYEVTEIPMNDFNNYYS